MRASQARNCGLILGIEKRLFFLEVIKKQSGAIQPPTQRIPAVCTRG